MSNGVALEVGVFLSCLVCLGSAATATAAASATTLRTSHFFPKYIPFRFTCAGRDRVQLLLLVLEVLGIGCRGQVASTSFPTVSTHCIEQRFYALERR